MFIREQSLRWDKIYILLAAVGHLVYIQVDGLGEKIPVYQVYVENAFTPIFSYQEHENNICETGGESTYVKYNQVCENEFFATTQKGMDALVGLKKEMIEKYNEK